MSKRLNVENCVSFYVVRTARLVPRREDPSEDPHEGLVCACVFVCRGHNLSAIQGRYRVHSPLQVLLVIFMSLPGPFVSGLLPPCHLCPVSFSVLGLIPLRVSSLVVSDTGKRGHSHGRIGLRHPALATATLIFCPFLSNTCKSSY